MKPFEVDDKALESPAQKQVHELVSQLPEDSLSLAWRSALNEKLLATAPKPRRSVWTWMMKPAAGLAVAGALAVVLISRTGISPSPSPVAVNQTTSNGQLEAALIQDHRELVQVSDVVGAGLNPEESSPSETLTLDGNWNEYDFESL
jgi:hypothetical protein